MGAFPTTITEPIVTIHPYSIDSIATHIQGFNLGGMSNAASAIWPTANKAIFVPFVLAKPIIVTKLFCYNGAAVSGNVDIGIYDSIGTRLISSGSTVQSGTSAIQEFDVTDTQIGPGLFYLALVLDNGTGTIFRLAIGNSRIGKFMGLAEQASAFALPATATMATYTLTNIPIFGLTTRTVI